MDILPIKSIREEDSNLVGKNISSLAKLYHFNIGVSDGVVVFPPSEDLKKVLSKYGGFHHESFEQKATLIRREIFLLKPPEDLVAILKKRKINLSVAWNSLLGAWFSEIKSKVFREGINVNVSKNLTAHTIFFVNKITSSGEIYFDKKLDRFELSFQKGNLSEENLDKLKDLIMKASKKLYLPFIYQWVFDGEFKIIKLVPFTAAVKLETVLDSDEVIIEKGEEPLSENLPIIASIKSKPISVAINIFLNISKESILVNDVDGVIICGEEIADYELKTRKLAEVASQLIDKPVIYKLADLKDPDKIRGTLNLIHDQSLLRKEAEVFLFTRNKKRLLNTQLAVPFVRSPAEFLQIKTSLSALGIQRTPTLKLWLELATPENFLNLEGYLEAQFDGAIINLDSILGFLGGFETSNFEENIFYKEEVQALVSFLEDGIRILQRARIPVILVGNSLSNIEVLQFALSRGVWGICVNSTQVISIKEQLSFHIEHQLKHKVLN